MCFSSRRHSVRKQGSFLVFVFQMLLRAQIWLTFTFTLFPSLPPPLTPPGGADVITRSLNIVCTDVCVRRRCGFWIICNSIKAVKISDTWKKKKSVQGEVRWRGKGGGGRWREARDGKNVCVHIWMWVNTWNGRGKLKQCLPWWSWDPPPAHTTMCPPSRCQELNDSCGPRAEPDEPAASRTTSSHPCPSKTSSLHHFVSDFKLSYVASFLTWVTANKQASWGETVTFGQVDLQSSTFQLN